LTPKCAADNDRTGLLVGVETQQEIREAKDGAARARAVAAANGFR
jgi:hypothetical protein